MISQCPGAKNFTRPKPEIIKCPFCSEEIEIWTDEIKAVCPKCKKTVSRKQDLSCVEWCKYAKDCVGEQIYSNYLKNKQENQRKKQ